MTLPDFNDYSNILRPVYFSETASSRPSSTLSDLPAPAVPYKDIDWKARCELLNPKWYEKQKNVHAFGKYFLAMGVLFIGMSSIAAIKRNAALLSIKAVSGYSIAAFSTTILGIHCLTRKIFPEDPAYMIKAGPLAEADIKANPLSYASYEVVEEKYPGMFTEEDIKNIASVNIDWDRRCRSLEPQWHEKQKNIHSLGTYCLGFGLQLTGLTSAVAFTRFVYPLSVKIISALAVTAFNVTALGVYCLTKTVFRNDPTYMSVAGPKAEEDVKNNSLKYPMIEKKYPGFFTDAQINDFLAKDIDQAPNFPRFISGHGKEALKKLSEANRKKLTPSFLTHLKNKNLGLIVTKKQFNEWPLLVSEEDLSKTILERELQPLTREGNDYKRFVDRNGAEAISYLSADIQARMRNVFLQYVLKHSLPVDQIQTRFGKECAILKIDIEYYKRLIVFHDFNRFLDKEISFEAFKRKHGPAALEAMPEDKICEALRSDAQTLGYVVFRRKYGINILRLLQRHGYTSILERKFTEMTDSLIFDELPEYKEDCDLFSVTYQGLRKKCFEEEIIDPSNDISSLEKLIQKYSIQIFDEKLFDQNNPKIKELIVNYIKNHYDSIFANMPKPSHAEPFEAQGQLLKEAREQLPIIVADIANANFTPQLYEKLLSILSNLKLIPYLINIRIQDNKQSLFEAQSAYENETGKITTEYQLILKGEIKKVDHEENKTGKIITEYQLILKRNTELDAAHSESGLSQNQEKIKLKNKELIETAQKILPLNQTILRLEEDKRSASSSELRSSSSTSNTVLTPSLTPVRPLSDAMQMRLQNLNSSIAKQGTGPSSNAPTSMGPTSSLSKGPSTPSKSSRQAIDEALDKARKELQAVAERQAQLVREIRELSIQQKPPIKVQEEQTISLKFFKLEEIVDASGYLNLAKLNQKNTALIQREESKYRENLQLIRREFEEGIENSLRSYL